MAIPSGKWWRMSANATEYDTRENGLETETAHLCLQLVNASSVSVVFGGNASADVTDVMSIDTLAVMGGVPVVCVCAPNLCDMVSIANVNSTPAMMHSNA